MVDTSWIYVCIFLGICGLIIICQFVTSLLFTYVFMKSLTKVFIKNREKKPIFDITKYKKGLRKPWSDKEI